MAAYAALLSLMNTIHIIQNHPHPPISLHQKQVYPITQNLTLLQTFLERYSAEDELESRIACAAYAAEDVIESHIVDQTEDGRSTSHGESIDSVDLYQGLERVIHDMDLIIKEVSLIIEDQKIRSAPNQHQLRSSSSVNSTASSNAMVGFDDVLMEVMDKLTGLPHNLQIIILVGMGGIGKTTLARNIYADSLIVGHFQILAWVTISREFSRREILQLLYQDTKGIKNDVSHISEDELGEEVYKELWSRRYLIVMDDIWSIAAWDKVKTFFPDNNNGSKIMMTTRLSNLATQLSGSHYFQMKFLNTDFSWNLLRENVFGEQGCPVELEDIGKRIAKSCRGLPLSIVVIGGLLAKCNMTREYWEYILQNLTSRINLENEEYCLEILRTSYKELPVHLKPCFLYLGVFPEDYEIRVSPLIKLWVAEGFLKPIEGKSLEDVARDYFTELIDRNLVLVHELSWRGKTKLCKIHDLLRDMCLREAQKQDFLSIQRQKDDHNIPQCVNTQRRICFNHEIAMDYAPLARSLLLIRDSREQAPSFNFKLLRIYSVFDEHRASNASGFASLEAIFARANLRYLCTEFDILHPSARFPSSWSPFWSLQTLCVHTHSVFFDSITAPPEFWEMRQLRHVMVEGVVLPDPPPGWEDTSVLENLQTLSQVLQFKCSDDVVKRIPNVKKLKIDYNVDSSIEEKRLLSFCFNNLGHLQRLESLGIFYYSGRTSNPEIFRDITFPHSLKKLSLHGTKLYWDDMTSKIGSLPLLEFLSLSRNSCIGSKWETTEGEFRSLKLLKIWGTDLENWETSNTHFPKLKHIFLQFLRKLDEIPSCIGDIPSLQTLHILNCSKSAQDSAGRIKEEQEFHGNVDLNVQIGAPPRRDRRPD